MVSFLFRLASPFECISCSWCGAAHQSCQGLSATFDLESAHPIKTRADPVLHDIEDGADRGDQSLCRMRLDSHWFRLGAQLRTELRG